AAKGGRTMLLARPTLATLFILFPFVASCAEDRPDPPTNPIEATSPQTKPAGQDQATGSPKAKPTKKPALKTTYNGLLADAWAKRLHDANPQISNEAGMALNRIGKEAIPYLLEGMKSEQDHVRYHSVDHLNYEAARHYKDEVIPALTSLLKDRFPMVRQ